MVAVVREVVRLENVSVRNEGVTVLEGIDLSIMQDDFLGIIGPNGSGKTTLLKVILGLIKPTSGRVMVLGKSPDEGRKSIGYVSQSNLFDREFPASVWEVALMGRAGKAGLFNRYNSTDRAAAQDALRTVGMLEHKHRQVGKLSGGEQQRTLIARALATEPQLLLLDEPMASVDPAMQAEFYELLENLRHKMTIVMVSHDVGAVSVYVDKIACINHRLFYHGSKEISADVLENTYGCPLQLITHGEVPHRVLKEH